MQTAKAWLPAEALSDGVLSTRICALADAWSRRWLHEPKPAHVRSSPVSDATKLSDDKAIWASPSRDLFLTASATGLTRLGATLLGIPSLGPKPTNADLALLRAIANGSLADSARACGDMFYVAPPAQPGVGECVANEGFLFVIEFRGGGLCLDLFVRHDTAIAARKASSSVRRPPILGRLHDALAPQTIHVGAMLGTGRMTLADLRSLSCGDVLVLDAAPDESLPLTVNGRTQANVRCKLARGNAALELHMTQFVSPSR